MYAAQIARACAGFDARDLVSIHSTSKLWFFFSASAIVYTRWRLSFFPAAGLMIKMCFKKLTPMQFAIFNIPQVI